MSEANHSLGNTTKFASRVEMAREYGNTAVRFYLQAIARNLLSNHRIQVCWRYPLPERTTIDLIYSEERKRARAAGTMKCGSAWVCAPCGLYISERRRVELGHALQNSRNKYAVVMITYTASHSVGHRLTDLLRSMAAAFRWVKSGRFWQTAKEEFSLVGSVRTLEITFGENGWHPHYHELMFVDIDHLRDFYDGSIHEYAGGLEGVLSERWIRALKREGLSGSKEIALRISDTDDAAKDYILKYGKMPLVTDFKGQTDEITRGTTKTARRGNLTPWDMLFMAPDNRRMRGLFLEFADSTKGRSQLQWSRGLKKLLDIDTIRDELACEGVETETDRILAQIPVELWRYIAERGYLPQVMTYANTGEEKKVRTLIAQIEEKCKAETYVIPQFDLGH